jgi:hypothetical protein
MSFKTFRAISIGLIGLSVAGIASAGALSEYGSLASWDAAVSNVSTYQIAQVPGRAGYGTFTQEFGTQSVAIGPGTFTGDTQSAAIYNDGLYGAGVQYFSDAPQSRSDHSDFGSVTVAFSAIDDITALAFDLGAGLTSSDVDIAVNGSALAPVSVGFFGVTDSKSPITSITFTEDEGPGEETDVIGSYQAASARPTAAPEISLASAPAAVTFLLGLLAVMRSRRTSKMRAAREGP